MKIYKNGMAAPLNALQLKAAGARKIQVITPPADATAQ
jgi:hypothetical protein